MMVSARRCVHIADARTARWMLTSALMLGSAAMSAHAQQAGWRPQKLVEIVAPSAGGGAQDILARHIQRILQNGQIVDVPIVIINKPGGGGNLALTHLDQRVGEGHVLFNSTMGLMTNHIVGRSKVTYTDYTPVAILFSEATVFVVKPESPLRRGRDVMEKLRADPHSLSNAEQGRLRILGVSTERRGDGALAEVPTWKEQGFNVVFNNTRFLVGPKGMGPAQTAFWDAALERLVQHEEWKNEVAKNYWTPDYVGSKQSGQRMGEIYAQLREALTDVGLAKE